MNRLLALSAAEGKQFFRNILLVSMAPFPVLLAVFMVLVDSGRFGVTFASSMYVLCSLGFVVYYSALSMATTRRDENVLKRLRTGEARDWEILTAIGIPLSLLIVVMAPLTVALVNYIATDDVPTLTNPLYMIAAILLGIPMSHGLALLTSRYTQNAEAAMITSFPVLAFVMFSFPGGIRELLPDRARTIVDWNPFALAADLFCEGWLGATLTNPGRALAALGVWAVVLVWVGYRRMRWETHR